MGGLGEIYRNHFTDGQNILVTGSLALIVHGSLSSNIIDVGEILKSMFDNCPPHTFTGTSPS